MDNNSDKIFLLMSITIFVSVFLNWSVLLYIQQYDNLKRKNRGNFGKRQGGLWETIHITVYNQHGGHTISQTKIQDILGLFMTFSRFFRSSERQKYGDFRKFFNKWPFYQDTEAKMGQIQISAPCLFLDFCISIQIWRATGVLNTNNHTDEICNKIQIPYSL